MRCENLFALLCAVGLLGHVFLISRRYFAYETSTKVIIDTDCPIEAPTLSYCIRYIDMMNASVLQEKFNMTINETTPTFEKYYKQSGNLKLSDIFNNTPTGECILDSCMIRPANHYRRVLRSTREKDKCFNFFNITKYYMQSFMCYRFMPANASFFQLHELAHSYNYEYSIYAIRLLEKLAHVESVLLILNYGPYPYISRSFGSVRKTRFTENSEERPNEYFVQTKVTEVSLQPPPYDTACDPDFDQSSRAECIIRGMIEQGLGRVPNTEIIPRPYDLPHVLYNDDDNVTFRALADKVYGSCYEKFKQSKCSYSIAATDVRMKADDRNYNSLRIRVMGPRGPNTHVRSEPAFPLSEYLLYVSSCFGIWLGVSVNRFNPFTLLTLWKRHNSCKRVHLNTVGVSKEARARRDSPVMQRRPVRQAGKRKHLPSIRESNQAAGNKSTTRSPDQLDHADSRIPVITDMQSNYPANGTN